MGMDESFVRVISTRRPRTPQGYLGQTSVVFCVNAAD